MTDNTVNRDSEAEPDCVAALSPERENPDDVAVFRLFGIGAIVRRLVREK